MEAISKRNWISWVLITLLIAVSAVFSQDRPSGVIDIGSRLELMVDDYLIERMGGGAELRLHRPVEREVVFTCDKPWEGNYSGYTTLFQDGDIYRMYYHAANWKGLLSETHPTFLCYAESTDGVNWTRPALGLVEFEGSKDNNIIMPVNGILSFVPLKDSNPNCKAEEQYKALVFFRPTDELPRALWAYISGDGINWKPMRKEPVITKGYFDSQNVAFWDSVRGRYVDFHRQTRGPNDEIHPEGPQLGLDDKGPARDVLTSTSADFINWTEPQWLQYPGAPREQLYLNQILPYYRAPHFFVGFPARFMAAREIEKDLPLTEHEAYEYGSITETLFMSSRDGVHFNRWGEAFIRPGLRRSGWIYGSSFPAYGLLVTPPNTAGMPDELSMYVDDGGVWTDGGKATRIRRYTTRIDGFVSVQAPLSGGEFVTKPLVFAGKQLVMNFSTSAAGSVQVEIQDDKGSPIPGFRLADAPEIFGDQIERVVNWQGGSDVSQLEGKAIRLRFVLKDADLFSFRFTSAKIAPGANAR